MKGDAEAVRLARWVLRAQSGDSTALDQLLLATQEWLARFLRRVVRDPHTAEDVAQETFLLIFRKLKFLEEPLAYRTWVYRIATRTAFRRLKLGFPPHRESLDVESTEPPTHDEPFASPEVLSEALAEKIRQLSPNTQVVVVLHYLEGLSISQTGDVLGLSVGTVKSRLAFGLAKMRESIAD